LDLGVRASAGRRYSVLAEVTDGSQEITFDDDLGAVREWYRKLDKIEGNKYYLVREAVLAEAVNYNIDSSFFADLGGEAKIAELAEVNPKLEALRSSSYDLRQTFDDPLRICIKPEELRQTARGDVPGEEVQLVPVYERLEIRGMAPEA
jgi:hypothetical protein